jgi:hypothetical protein
MLLLLLLLLLPRQGVVCFRIKLQPTTFELEYHIQIFYLTHMRCNRSCSCSCSSFSIYLSFHLSSYSIFLAAF